MNSIKKNKPGHIADKLSYTIGALDGVWWTLCTYCETKDIKSIFMNIKPVMEKKLNTEIEDELMNTVMKNSILSRQ